MVKGLADIKAKNVMHRDLKLPNVLLHFKNLPVDQHRIKARGGQTDFNLSNSAAMAVLHPNG